MNWRNLKDVPWWIYWYILNILMSKWQWNILFVFDSSGCIAVGGIVSYYQHWNFLCRYSLSTKQFRPWGTTLICNFILQKNCRWVGMPPKLNYLSSICPCSLFICIKKKSLEKTSDLGFDAGCLLCVLPHLQAQIRLGPGRDKIYQTLSNTNTNEDVSQAEALGR